MIEDNRTQMMDAIVDSGGRRSPPKLDTPTDGVPIGGEEGPMPQGTPDGGARRHRPARRRGKGVGAVR